MKHKVDLKTKMIMDFFQPQGVTFVDSKTGEEIEPITEEGEE